MTTPPDIPAIKRQLEERAVPRGFDTIDEEFEWTYEALVASDADLRILIMYTEQLQAAVRLARIELRDAPNTQAYLQAALDGQLDPALREGPDV